MTRRLTILAVLVCSVSAMLFGAAGIYDGVKQYDPIPMSPDTSAPDAWGYTWVRSTDPGGPTFNWVDISTIGTEATGLGDDNSVGPFPMLFNFQYYWYTVGNFRIGSNGYIVFGNQTANFASPFAALPNTAAPNDMLAILAGDLDFTVAAANAHCYYWSNGVDSLVVTFVDVTEWQTVANPNLRHTFQVILNKQDSSITYQYGRQQGQYNATNNTTLSVGIENQTGQIGLNYTFSTVPPHALMPDSGLAIKIKRTVNTGLAVTDAGIVGGFDAENRAKMFIANQPATIQTLVKNFGTADLSNIRVTYAITRTGQPTARDTVFLASLLVGEQSLVSFPRLFTPAVTGSYSAAFSAFVAGDVGPGNNNKTAELVSTTFSMLQNSLLAYETNTQGTTISWNGGGGGMGVEYDLPASVYPVRIESVYVRTTTAALNMIVEILDGSTGIPGAVLATRTVTSINGMNAISFVSDSVRISSGKFFVGARGDIAATITWSLETAAPISYRTWEYTNGYAPYRSRDVQDMILRIAARQEPPPTPAPGWNAQTSGITTLLRNVKAVNSGTGWIGGSSGVVLRTINAGSAWSSVGGGAIGTGAVHCMTALDQNTALVGSSPLDGFIFRTSNAGATWTQVYQQAGGFFDAVHMFDASNGIAFGDPVGGRWTILRTADGGVTWVQDTVNAPPQVGAEAGWINSFHAIGSSRFWFGTNNNRIYYTTDGGLTWSFGTTTQLNSFAVWFNNTQEGVAGFTTGTGVARTTDGGATWTDVTMGGAGSVYGVTGSGVDYWVPRGGAVYRSTDRGATWTSEYTSTIGTSLRHINFVRTGSTTSGWVVSSIGGIASFYGTVTGIEDQTWEVPEEFALAQNFPNPFNPSTTIRYNVPKNAFVTLRVYDLLGQEVVTLRDEMQNVGSYEVVWNGHNAVGQTVASGVYFYRLEARPASGGEPFNSINKMLMLK